MGAELLLSVTGDQTVDNTTTETSIFSDTVPAGTPGTNQLLICRHISDIRNDSGSAATATLRWKYGGTTFFTFTTISLADAGATNRYADIGTMFLGGENATNAQRAMFDHRQSGAISTGPPGLYAGGNDHNTSVKSGTVDSTSAQTLELTAQLSATNTELEYRRRGVWVEHWTTSDPGSGTEGTRLVNIDATEVTVVNTMTETSVYSCTIPGGTIGTGNLLILRMHMDAVNNTGVDRQWWSDVYYGGTQIFDGVTGTNNTTAATRRAFPIEVWIGGGGATNAQVCAMIGQGIGTGVATSGEGVGFGQQNAANNSVSSCAVDSTVDQTLEVRVDMNAADPNLEVRKLVGSVTVVKA